VSVRVAPERPLCGPEGERCSKITRMMPRFVRWAVGSVPPTARTGWHGGHVSKRGRRSCHRGTCSPDLDGWPWRACNPARMPCTDTDTGCPLYRYRPAALSSTGFASASGVSSSASRPCTRIRDPSTVITRTRCRPMGLGRPGERVLKTPAGGLCGLSPGRVTGTSRRDRSSQVGTMISVPARRSRIPSVTSGSNTSHAGGAPRLPWRLRPVFQW
jgi:hypothetical protein